MEHICGLDWVEDVIGVRLGYHSGIAPLMTVTKFINRWQQCFSYKGMVIQVLTAGNTDVFICSEVIH